jgi:hypothetical protein
MNSDKKELEQRAIDTIRRFLRGDCWPLTLKDGAFIFLYGGRCSDDTEDFFSEGKTRPNYSSHAVLVVPKEECQILFVAAIVRIFPKRCHRMAPRVRYRIVHRTPSGDSLAGALLHRSPFGMDYHFEEIFRKAVLNDGRLVSLLSL